MQRLQPHHPNLIAGLTCLFVIVVISSVTSEIDKTKPIGPKMCKRLCNQIVGCSSFSFMTSDLSCQLDYLPLGNRLLQSESGIVSTSKEKGVVLAVRDMNCPKFSKLFYSRRRIRNCVRFRPKRRQQEESGRLLMFAWTYDGSTEQGRQLFLHNNTIVKSPCISGGMIIAVTFISTKSKFVISTLNPEELAFISMNCTNKISVKKHVRLSDIHVDENKHLIIALSLYTDPGLVYTFNTEGENFQQISQNSFLIDPKNGIAVDTGRSFIYIYSRLHGLIKLSYQGVMGKRLNTFDVCSSSSITIDVSQDSIYYIKQQNIIKMSLATYKQTKVHISITRIPVLFKVANGRFYIFEYPFDGNMSIIDENGKILQIQSGLQPQSHTIKIVFVL